MRLIIYTVLPGKYTGCPNYSGGPGTACKIFQGSPELLSKLFSLFFPFSPCHSHCHLQNSLQITRNYIDNLTGYPGTAGAVVPANFRGTRTSFGLLLRGSPKFCY
jgi:hypothetical protein